MNAERAVIDIGSNTVRLVIFGGPARAPSVLLNEKVTARLGKGVADNGRLTNKSMQAALAALARYAAILRLRGVERVETVATAASRDAENGAEFLDAVRLLGLDVRLLSGEEEALTSATGVIAAFPGAKGIVADIGGGSLELVDIDGEICEHGTSLPLGTLRLPQMREGGPAKFVRRVEKLLDMADWCGGENLPLYLVGGSHRALAHYAMHKLHWPFDDPHGFTMSSVDALDLCREMEQGQLATDVPMVSSSRLTMLPDTAALLAALLTQLRPSKVVFSSWGLREGLLYRQLTRHEQAEDPLLAGVKEFTETLGCPAKFAELIARWTAIAAPAAGDGRKRLRLAATMLALAAYRTEPNLRAEEAVEWALRKRWVGVDGEGRAMIAAAVCANTGRNAQLPELERIASPASLHEGRAWGLAIRLARRFSAGSPDALAQSALSVEGNQLVLAMRKPISVLFTNPAEKDLKALAQVVGLDPAMRVIGADGRLS
ncbi:exopolyphosphatase [Croceicoccus estronivorus]|uniref:Ppx/GppA phosphatase family protein n=1 Tax=Croceicoccus estronivorus TaxID=1172626 RepID=UPI00083775EE|nr:exopolyphosphatase [Croceicoccus estronivorus]OCC22561.1 exopolyphosphatase [Croceicoccus estronivorus]